MRSPRRFGELLVPLYGALVGLVGVLMYRRQDVVEGVVDLNGFGALARNIANGEGFSLGHGPTIRRGPFYPYLGAAILRLFGSSDNSLPDVVYYRPLVFANCVILGLTCFVVFRLASELFGRRAGILAAVVCPLVPQSLRYVGMTEIETLMGLWTALLAWTSVRLVQSPSPKTGAWFGLVAAGATLTKPIVLLYPFFLLPLAAWSWRRARALDRKAIVGTVIALACFGAALLPWSLRNMAITGGEFKGISSNGPGEFLRGYINAQPKYFLLQQDFGGSGPNQKWDPEANQFEEALLKPHGVPFYYSGKYSRGRVPTRPPIPEGVTSAQIELEKDRIEGAEMKRRLVEEPFAFLYKFGVQLASFWYIVETRRKSLIVGAIALTMLTLAVLGARSRRVSSSPLWPVAAVLLYFNAIYAAFLAFARYSMPLYPTLTVLAAGGVLSLLEPALSRWRGQKSRPSAAVSH